ncbi:MAG TPA: peptidase U32, partial [Sporomusaceae bacterium]|nr:peptidase U32 [Sporomusaceae bacterium]
LNKISHRPYTLGFYFAKPNENDQIYSGSSNTQTHDFVGLVGSYDAERQVAVIEQRNNIKVGEEIEIAQPGQPNFSQVIHWMKDLEGNSIQVAPHPLQLVTLPVSQPVVPFAMLRRKVSEQ